MTDIDALIKGGHTPGPWKVSFYDCGDRDYYDHNGPTPSIQAPDDQDCAIVHWDGFKQEYWSSANGNQKQIEANARLIAAAPDLLEALTIERAKVAALEDENAKLKANLAAARNYIPHSHIDGDLRTDKTEAARWRGVAGELAATVTFATDSLCFDLREMLEFGDHYNQAVVDAIGRLRAALTRFKQESGQ